MVAARMYSLFVLVVDLASIKRQNGRMSVSPHPTNASRRPKHGGGRRPRLSGYVGQTAWTSEQHGVPQFEIGLRLLQHLHELADLARKQLNHACPCCSRVWRVRRDGKIARHWRANVDAPGGR